MNWGAKISILYGGFVLLIVTMVGMSMNERSDLVSKDYYAQELKYQDKIDRMNRTSELKEGLIWKVENGSVVLNFPASFSGQKISGKINFFRPSDAQMDKLVNLAPDTALSRIVPTNSLKKGTYKLEIIWGPEQDNYYNEGYIQIK